MQRISRTHSGIGAPAATASQPESRARKLAGGRLATALLILQVAILTLPQGLDYEISRVPTEGDASSRIVWLVLLFGGIFLLARHRIETKTLVAQLNRYLLMFLALATLSILWSIEPAFTLRRIFRIVSVLVVCGGFCVSGWHAHRFQIAMRTIMTAVLIASVIFVYLEPTLAIHQSMSYEMKGAWRGIALGKNLFGSVASATVLFWVHAWLSKESKPLVAICGVGLSVYCLVMSRSSTSLMATMFGVMFMLILLRPPGSLRRYVPYMVGIFATIILIYALAVLRIVPAMDFVLKPITMITGKDLTFTGRTEIWNILNEHIRWHPLLGTGYGAYWIDSPNSPSQEMVWRLWFYPTEGHNGYLDVINDLGIVGGLVLLGYFIVYIKQSLLLMRTDRYQGGLYLTLLFRGFIGDMSESHWFNVLTFDFLVLTLATVALAKSLVESRADMVSQRARQSLQRATQVAPPGRRRPTRDKFGSR